MAAIELEFEERTPGSCVAAQSTGCQASALGVHLRTAPYEELLEDT